jgi:hypothetical protein
MGGRRPRLGAREWSGGPLAGHAVLYAAVGGSLTLTTVVVGLLNAVSAPQAIALGVLATLATAGGMIGLVIPDAWAAWRRGFQQGFKLGMNRQAQRTQSNHRARRTRRSVAGDKPQRVAGDRPEPVAGDRPDPVAGDRPDPVAGDRQEAVAGDRPEPVANGKPEPIARGDASGSGEHVIVSLSARCGKPSLGKSSRHR